jgi:hypothetical protein
MLISAVLFLSLLSIAQSVGGRDCGSREPLLQSDIEFEQRVSANSLWRRDSAVIPVLLFDLDVHIFIISSPSYQQQNVSNQMIIDQISVISEDYSAVFKSINIASINRVENSSWVPLVKNSESERDMKRMRRGGKDTLNVYIVDLLSAKLGWGNFPQDIERFGLQQDGVVIRIFATNPPYRYRYPATAF